MTPLRRISESIANLLRYPLRSGFMMLGCLLGVAALNLVLTVGSSLERRVVTSVQMYFSASSILVTGGGNPFGGGPRGDNTRLTLDDIKALAIALPDIEVWDPMQILDPVTLKTAEAATTGRVVGSSENAELVWQRALESGEYFDSTAVARLARVALIGTTVKQALFADQDPLGSELMIGGAPYRIIGVLESTGTDVHGIDRDNEVVVPISTMQRRIMNVDTIRGAKLLVKNPLDVARVAAELKGLLRERHALGPDQKDDFTVVTPVEVQKLVGLTKRVLFLFLPLMAGIALLLGGVVAASLMLSAVGERVAEIGLRRAVGAHSSDIALQFLLEASITTLVGGIFGTVLGVAGAQAIARHWALQTAVSPGVVILGLVLAGLVGILAGLIPARRAARLNPVDALR